MTFAIAAQCLLIIDDFCAEQILPLSFIYLLLAVLQAEEHRINSEHTVKAGDIGTKETSMSEVIASGFALRRIAIFLKLGLPGKLPSASQARSVPKS